MEGKTVVIIILIAVFVIIIGVVIYIITKDKIPETSIPLNFFVGAIDKITKKEVETNFVVVQQNGLAGSNKTIIFQGKTNLEGVLEEVNTTFTENSSYYILNYGNGYYGNAFVWTNQKKVILELYKIGELNISLSNKTNTNFIINLTTDDNQYRQMGFCIKHSIGYLYVETGEFNQIQSPTRLKNEYPDKCYYTFTSLDQASNFTKIINLNYSPSLAGITENDWVELIFFDSDRSYLNDYIIEDINGNDVGGIDYRLLIKN